MWCGAGGVYDSVCDGVMIEELLGSLCAEDVLGSFSVTMSSEPPHALCAITWAVTLL